VKIYKCLWCGKIVSEVDINYDDGVPSTPISQVGFRAGTRFEGNFVNPWHYCNEASAKLIPQKLLKGYIIAIGEDDD